MKTIARTLAAIMLVGPQAVPVQAQRVQAPDFTQEEVDAARQDPDYYTIDEKTVSLKRLGPTVNPTEIAPPPTPPGQDEGMVLDRIINIAKKIWTIIESNKPVVDVKNTYATAVPEGTTNWSQLDSWKPPRGSIYGLTAKNAYGVTVIDIRYQVLRTYGGQYKGKGRYLTAVTVEPLRVDVMWGYKLTMTAETPDSSLVNIGTKEDPIAGMLATLRWRISTTIKDSQGKGVYFLQGDGGYQEVGGPFSAEHLAKADRTVVSAQQLVVE